MIWTFGDSFSKHFDHLPDTWVERTRRLLNEEVISYSKPFTTLEYNFHMFNKEKENFKPNDIVLMSITTLTRRWFSKERPFRILKLSKEEAQSLNYYNRYLNNIDEIHKTYFINFMYNINYVSKKKQIHTIILLNFFDFDSIIDKISSDLSYLNIAKGRIGIISDNEYKPHIVNMSGVDWFMKMDTRFNHLIKSNHIRISDKIIDNIQNKNPIDLTQGLVQGILDDNLINDPEFIKEELFNREFKKNRDN